LKRHEKGKVRKTKGDLSSMNETKRYGEAVFREIRYRTPGVRAGHVETKNGPGKKNGRGYRAPFHQKKNKGLRERRNDVRQKAKPLT